MLFDYHLVSETGGFFEVGLVSSKPGQLQFESLYRRVSHRSGKNAAKVAVARKMLTCIYHMLKGNEPFKDIKRRPKRITRTGAGKLAGVIA